MSAPSHAGVGPAIFCGLRYPRSDTFVLRNAALVGGLSQAAIRIFEIRLISSGARGTQNGTLRTCVKRKRLARIAHTISWRDGGEGCYGDTIPNRWFRFDGFRATAWRAE